MSIFQIAAWAGAIMTILGLVTYMLKPIVSSFTKITANLTEITHSLDLINKSIELSQTDRLQIHTMLDDHDRRLDDNEIHLTRHDEQIKTLFNIRKGGE